MNLSAAVRTMSFGALLAALIGCIAGAYLRPELGEPRIGQTLVVTPAPAAPEYFAYAPVVEEIHDSW